MKVELESTNRIVDLEINGTVVPARIWQGRTENGIECHAFITRIAVRQDRDASEFERDLRETVAPIRADLAEAIPARLVL
jgi:hypothetical protein